MIKPANLGEPAPEATRGRPRNQQTHGAILEAARTLLRREGETRFSIEQVASAAGVSKASIYRRWPTKGALLDAAKMVFAERGFDAATTREIAGRAERSLFALRFLDAADWQAARAASYDPSEAGCAESAGTATSP